MFGNNRKSRLRKLLVAAMASTAINLILGATPAAAQLSPLHDRCAAVAVSVDDGISACSTPGHNLAVSFFNRGLGWSRKRDYGRAISDFDQAIRIDANYARAYHGRGMVHGSQEKYDQALADFDRAIQLDPTFAPAFNSRAFTYLKKGAFDRAIADAENAIRLNPNLAGAYVNRGSAYAQKGELGRAMEDVNRALRINPSLANAYNARGLIYRKRGDMDRALADFNEAVRLDPAFAAAYNNRALVRKDRGDLGGAISDLNEALRINSRYALAYETRALVHEQKGDRARALADFNAALSIEPSRTEAQAGRLRTAAAPVASRPADVERPKSVTSSPRAPGSGQPSTPSPPAAPSAPVPPQPAQARQAPPSETAGARTAVVPQAPASSLAETLVACEKSGTSPKLDVAVSGGNGKIKIPACYRGRRHLECITNALIEEAAAIDRDYGEIVRENYPDRKDVKAICSIPERQIEEHLARARNFDARATQVQQAYQGSANCVESVRAAIGEINLGPMRDPGALMVSVLEHVSEPVARASARQREVQQLVGQIAASQKAIATVHDLRRLVCSAD